MGKLVEGDEVPEGLRSTLSCCLKTMAYYLYPRVTVNTIPPESLQEAIADFLYQTENMVRTCNRKVN